MTRSVSTRDAHRQKTPAVRHRRAGLLTALILVLFIAVRSAPGYAAPKHAPQSAPCDIYAAAGTPCVAAFSSTRALFAGYDGPLYQVQRADNDATTDVGLLSTGGYADSRTQDQFCAGTTCIISTLYDQTANHNDLTVAGPGTAGGQDSGATADALPIQIDGHSAYGLYLPPKTGYRRSSTNTIGTARNGQPETIYEVASGTNANDDCCSDFGNVETKPEDTGRGHMDAVNISYMNAQNSPGTGPWVEADLENGVFQGGKGSNPDNHGNPTKFVSALLKNNGQDTFALKGGDAQLNHLSTWYEGALPSDAYTPMQQEGSIVLGTGGDNSNRGTGSFFEGVMTTGYSTDAADNAVQANIAGQHYSAVSTGGGPGTPILNGQGRCVDVTGDDAPRDNATIRLSACNAFAADQHWVASDFTDRSLITLGRCMSAQRQGRSAESRVVLTTCLPDNSAQQWQPQPDGTIRNVGTGLCLRGLVTHHSTSAPLRAAACDDSASEHFTVTVPIHHADKCIDVTGDDNGGSGAAVQLWDCRTLKLAGAAARDQQWTYNQPDRTLRTLGRCMTPAHHDTANGTKVELANCLDAEDQAWLPRADGTIFNPHSGRCLADPGNSTANGTQLELQDCTSVSAEEFEIN